MSFGLRASADSDVAIPSKMKFADMTLHITKEAKELIAAKIENLVKNEKLFNDLLHRVVLFMPIVENILKEEGLPIDFKYIPIQESSMHADADDTKSYGFWQFKPVAAQEVNLRMDHLVDERAHVIESTRGAAKYLASHNKYLNNWLCSLLAYNRGRGWVEQNGFKQYANTKSMKIDKDTHWYILHYLAHKIVFEKKIKKVKHPEIFLHIHENKNAQKQSLAHIAEKYKVDEEQLRHYNKWMKHAHIPHDKNYSVIVPLPHNRRGYEDFLFPTVGSGKQISLPSKLDYSKYVDSHKLFPKVSQSHADDERYATERKNLSQKKRINGLWGVFAREGDTIESLAAVGSISIDDFMEFNEIGPDHRVVAGHPYYFENKRRSAEIHFHIVRSGDSWWYVSQKYAIKQSSLMTKNREKKSHKNDSPDLEINRVLWMRYIRPAKVPVSYEGGKQNG